MVRDQFNSAHRLTTCAAVSQTGTPTWTPLLRRPGIVKIRAARYCIELELRYQVVPQLICVSWTAAIPADFALGFTVCRTPAANRYSQRTRSRSRRANRAGRERKCHRIPSSFIQQDSDLITAASPCAPKMISTLKK
jgi:hypothetical protein